jgi:16S rRNA A1518/A1519 N6-dimethyltransferase RsmA/KsgA/DIM1 with predicted DNA glycosylase/AP lyase activity
MLRQALAMASHSRWSKDEWDRHLRGLGIDSQRRAESLTMPEWIRLAESEAAGGFSPDER